MLYKTNILAGIEQIYPESAFASAVGQAVNTIDHWYPGILSILYGGLSALAAIEMARAHAEKSGARLLDNGRLGPDPTLN